MASDKFDPDAYLSSKADISSFNPDAYLEQKKPTLLEKGLASYAQFMGKEGGYGADPAGKLMSYVKKPFNKGGQALTEALGKRQVNPYLSAAAGTAVQMAPDIALTLGPGAPKEVPNEPGAFTKGLMSQAESSSGGAKGSLTEAYKDPKTILSRGKELARPLYQAAQSSEPEANLFHGVTKNTDIIDKAIEYTDKGGKLQPTEALTVRKAIDEIRNSKVYSKDILTKLRQMIDPMVKENPLLSKADPLYRKGVMGESLRNVMPQNKLGGASAFKMAIIPAMSGLGAALGGHTGAAVGTALGTAALSPLAQGVTATAAGIGAKLAKDPQLLSAVMEYLKGNGGQQ